MTSIFGSFFEHSAESGSEIISEILCLLKFLIRFAAPILIFRSKYFILKILSNFRKNKFDNLLVTVSTRVKTVKNEISWYLQILASK